MTNRALRAIMVAAPVLFLAPLAQAQPAWPDCPSNYPGGVPPRAVGATAPDVTDLCYHGFAVGFSQKKAGPLSSSHYLTRARMGATASSTAGAAPMHAETRVPESLRVQPSAFAASGYTAGQLTPSTDMADTAGKSDSMSVANMVPQTPQLHAAWAKLEQTARALATQYDVIYVVSGPVYQAGAASSGTGAPTVPAGVFKAFYNPEGNWGGAYVCANTAQPSCSVVTLASLQSLTGIDVFPAVSASVKSAAPPLPAPG